VTTIEKRLPQGSAALVELWRPALAFWLAAMDGVVAMLERGGRVADVLCGRGAAIAALAKAFPEATFLGLDPDAEKIRLARGRARQAGVERQIAFKVASPGSYGGLGFDMVTMLGCLDRIGDRARVVRHVRASLASDGVWMVLEPRHSLSPEREARLCDEIAAGGFGSVRRAASSAFDVLIEARP
jgi:cyclopropane fatty-acyl-phospholipid synthase-like methyltransferase